VAVTQRFFDQLVQFVQQGIAFLFRIIQLIWTWSVGQITTLLQVPWQEWPAGKRGALLVLIFIIGWVMYYAARELWAAGQTILTAFATVLGVLIRTLPKVLIAGLIALLGAWLLNNVDLSRVQWPSIQDSGMDRR
jgi:hypothetical protein